MEAPYTRTTLDKWLDEDLALIRDQSLWKECKKAKKVPAGGVLPDMCYVHKPDDGDSIWWFKIVAHMPDATLAQAEDLLDTSLEERSKEWHELLVGGKVIAKIDDATEVCYFQYSPAMFLVSGRDSCYVKTRRTLDNGAFLLSYRTVEHEAAPVTKEYVRLDIRGAHLIEPEGKGILYTYIQHLDAKVPSLITNKSLPGVMLKETAARYKAMSNPMVKGA